MGGSGCSLSCEIVFSWLYDHQEFTAQQIPLKSTISAGRPRDINSQTKPKTKKDFTYHKIPLKRQKAQLQKDLCLRSAIASFVVMFRVTHVYIICGCRMTPYFGRLSKCATWIEKGLWRRSQRVKGPKTESLISWSSLLSFIYRIYTYQLPFLVCHLPVEDEWHAASITSR